MLQSSAPRVKAYRQRCKQGIIATLHVPISNDLGYLLQELGYVQFPASRDKVVAGLLELLSQIDQLPYDVLAMLSKSTDNNSN